MKKKALIFGTLGASLLLAGGVFAAYAVTDNAEKIGIKISPSTIDTDATGTVTLSWGENYQANFSDISGLAIGSPNSDMKVKIIADAFDDDEVATSYEGRLTVELQDLSGKTGTAKKLIDYLNVEIKADDPDNVGQKVDLGEVGLAEGEDAIVTEAAYLIETDADGTYIYFTVSIDASAQPYINSIKNDRVYLSVDWGRSGEEDGVSHVYIPAPDASWSDMFIYTYGASGHNAEFPGVELQKDTETGCFVADINSEHTNFILSTKSGGENVTARYPGDNEPGASLEDAGLDETHIYFDWSSHNFVVMQDTSKPFYLVGEATDIWSMLAANGFTLNNSDKPAEAANQWVATLTVEAAKEYKVRSNTGSVWLGYEQIENVEGDHNPRSLVNPVEGTSNNFTFKAAGTYDFYLKQYGTENPTFSLYIANHA